MKLVSKENSNSEHKSANKALQPDKMDAARKR